MTAPTPPAISDFLDLYEQYLTAVKVESSARSLELTDQMCQKIAYDQAAASLNTSATGVPTNLSSLSKFRGDTAPENFVAIFENEAALCGISTDEKKLRIFPSLMGNAVAAAVQSKLRLAGSWDDMVKTFTDHFKVDKNVVIADLRALQVKDWDVEAYTTKFNQLAALYPMTAAEEQWLKQIYVDSLPYKVREHLQLDKDFATYNLSALQSEARRLQKTLDALRKGTPRQQHQQQQDGDKQKDDKNKEQNKQEIIFNQQKAQIEETESSIVGLHCKVLRTMHNEATSRALAEIAAAYEDLARLGWKMNEDQRCKTSPRRVGIG